MVYELLGHSDVGRPPSAVIPWAETGGGAGPTPSISICSHPPKGRS